jgi:chemotaxis protein methyltransferase CheR
MLHGRGEKVARIWCGGASTGEEPYTVKMIWEAHIKSSYPDMTLEIVATDSDLRACEVGKHAVYEASKLRDLPMEWIPRFFEAIDPDTGKVMKHKPYTSEELAFSSLTFHVKPELQQDMKFVCMDNRSVLPSGPLHCVLARNSLFMYLDMPARAVVLKGIMNRISHRGFLVLGTNDKLPPNYTGLTPYGPKFLQVRTISSFSLSLPLCLPSTNGKVPADVPSAAGSR